VKNTVRHQILEKVSKLNTNKSGERRSPHKPLLILVALHAFERGVKSISFEEVCEKLTPLLNSYAPPIKGKHQPELPFWHLIRDGVWEVEGSENFPMVAGNKRPQLAALKNAKGCFSSSMLDFLEQDPVAVQSLVKIILENHFQASIHEEIIIAVGLNIEGTEESIVYEDYAQYKARIRDPNFRNQVLRAYGHRCAVTGFKVELGGQPFGCEAAHIKWHAFEGPDNISNGIALEPTMHKLLDAGAWTLTDERRILVSKSLTGDDEILGKIRKLHGQPIRDPLPDHPKISSEFIQWHRNQEQGGVFRWPSL